MAFEQREGSGVLFKNDRKQPESKQPDYQGSVTIGGKEWRLAGWIKQGKKGPFLSLKASEPRQNDQPNEPPPF